MYVLAILWLIWCWYILGFFSSVSLFGFLVSCYGLCVLRFVIYNVYGLMLFSFDVVSISRFCFDIMSAHCASVVNTGLFFLDY